MANIEELKQQEINELKTKVEIEEVGLEELIVLGEHKKTPIHITYPNEDGTKTKSKALIRQLTLKELDKVKVNKKNIINLNREILKLGLFKSTGDKFTTEEINFLPLGVVKTVAEAILEYSGIDETQTNALMDF